MGSDNEGNLLFKKHIQAFDGLVLKSVHDIDDKNSDIAEGRATGTEVAEGFVTRGINHQKTRDLVLERKILEPSTRERRACLLCLVCALLQVVSRKVSRTNLLCDTSSFA